MDDRNEMNTELVNVDYNSMSPDLLNLIQEKVIFAKMKWYEDEIKKLNRSVERIQELSEQKTEEALCHLNDAKDIFTAKSKIRNAPNGYGSLTELGELFDGKVGAIHMGHLLRMVGLAMLKESKTVPYQNTPVKYCRQYTFCDIYGRENYSYVWNLTECKIAVEEWLEKHDLLVEFLKCSSKGKVNDYIKKIYNHFKSGEYRD